MKVHEDGHLAILSSGLDGFLVFLFAVPDAETERRYPR
jgi:hypothetical protein